MSKMNGPVRDISPCKGCERPDKKPGCHGNCEPYDEWRRMVEEINRKRAQYRDEPKPVYTDLSKRGKKW